MNGQESSTSADWRKDVRVSAVSTRLASDTIADTAHLALRFAERILRNGMVDVSPEGGFKVSLHLRDDEVPAFQNAIQLRVDLGETIDERFKASPREEPTSANGVEDLAAWFENEAREARASLPAGIANKRWFVSRLSYPDASRTVLAGDDFKNELVGIFGTAEAAAQLVRWHNDRLDREGAAAKDDADFDLAVRSRWIVSPHTGASGRTSVLVDGGDDAIIVGIWPSRDDARSVVATHNAALSLVGGDHGLSTVGRAIRDHALIVAYDEGLFAADGTPIVAKGIGEASERRERAAYKAVMVEPCETIEDVRAKANYLLNGTVGDRDPLVSIMKGLGADDPVSPDRYLDDFIRSLLGGTTPPAGVPDYSDDISDETMSALRAIGAEAVDELGFELPPRPQPPEPFETFTTLGDAAAPVLLRATLGRMKGVDFAEAANGRTFRLNRLVVDALGDEPTSIVAIAAYVRGKDPSATDDEIEEATARALGMTGTGL